MNGWKKAKVENGWIQIPTAGDGSYHIRLSLSGNSVKYQIRKVEE